ncbi:MAG TPA: single-stranded-DNA-specific exonuclease RecJ [Solirubrobacteraceae bacterium]|nr:single-stranded-DNA-specific exonuclease RecJ [Solirubrobacteraceae bacterium]
MDQAVLLLEQTAPPAELQLVEPPRPLAAHAPAAPPDRRLELPPLDLEATLRLQRELGIGRVLSHVLMRRGLADPLRARAFLEPADAHPPSAFAGIDRAVETVRAHIARRSRIVVHGDSDVDGVCATAVLVRALQALGADVGWFLPSRTEDGYGLSAATVARLAERGTGLLMTVDCGITAVEEVAAARAAGLEVIVTDHHSPRADGALPGCAIVHPALSGYPCADLCGTAVAFKLAEALEAPGTAGDLELVALATVADLMPLQAENRRLVQEGLHAMANTTRPGLRALIAISRTDPSELDAGALGFRLAPRINAAGRLRRADAGLELLLTSDPDRAREIAAELDAVNAERRAVEQRILWEAEAQVAELGLRSAYVLAGAGWHPGVVGIVASRIVERYHRPAVLIAIDEHGEGHGSGRSIPGFDLLGALDACAGHLGRYGGHRAAAGLAVAAERISDLRQDFEAHAVAIITPEQLVASEHVDAVVCGSELGLELAEELGRLEPCGMGNPRVRLLVSGARFTDVRPIGEGRHVRFSVSSGGARARAVAFGCDGRVPGGEEHPLDATFSLERNVWNGAVEPRLILRHAHPCAPRPILVRGEASDYLGAVWRELDRELAAASGDATAALAPAGVASAGSRTVLDARGRSPLALLRELTAGADRVLALCADVPRRLAGLSERSGGFELAAWTLLEDDASLVGGAAHLVALDPPAGPALRARLAGGSGYAHLAWGEPELRFAQQMYAYEHDLRAPLTSLFRGLRERREVAGEELVALLRGDGSAGPLRSPRMGGRLVRVLVELGLARVDRTGDVLAIGSVDPTTLERSEAYRCYARRLEEGLRYLSPANQLAS